jgi:hypothetical protein
MGKRSCGSLGVTDRVVFFDKFGVRRLDVIVAVLRIDGVSRLLDAPPQIRIDDRILNNVTLL